MAAVREYILSVVSAALICSVLTRLAGKKGSTGVLFRLIAGLFLAFTVIRPVAAVKIDALGNYLSDLNLDAEVFAAVGESEYRAEIGGIIKRETEAYILDKAHSLNSDITVDVQLDDQLPPIPWAVRITGNISPYAKSQLEDVIASDLGIQKERQIWIG